MAKMAQSLSITLAPVLYAGLKQAAAEDGLTLSSWIATAIRDKLDVRERQKAVEQIPRLESLLKQMQEVAGSFRSDRDEAVGEGGAVPSPRLRGAQRPPERQKLEPALVCGEWFKDARGRYPVARDVSELVSLGYSFHHSGYGFDVYSDGTSAYAVKNGG